MDVKDRELRLIPSKSLSDMNRNGFALVAFIVSVLLIYFSSSKQLPAKDQLSHYQISPLAFGTLQNSTTATKARDLGYAYAVAWDALPARYDKSAPPPVWESSFDPKNKGRNILIHDAIKISPFEVDKLGELVNHIIDVWFWEGKIVVVEVSGKKIVPYELAVSGINQERNLMLLAAGLSILLGIGLVFYPRLKLS
jgi:hypothetical protein